MIRLSTQDIDFLCGFKPPLDLEEVLHTARQKGGFVTDDQADALRDFYGDCLQFAGFGPDYQPTLEGQRLERLIDQLFVG